MHFPCFSRFLSPWRGKARRALGLLSAACLAFAAPAFASAPQQPVEGRDYVRLEQPLIPSDQSKVEVVEFFSYGCIHCNDFAPILAAWEKQRPNVLVRRIPLGGNMVTDNLARLYYTLVSLGDWKRLDESVFSAINEERQRIFTVETQAQWYARHGGDAGKFTDVWKSFGVDSDVRRAEQLGNTWKIDATPTLVVDGQYVVKGDSFDDMLNNVDKLVAMVKAQAKK